MAFIAPPLLIEDWGLLEYDTAWQRQQQRVDALQRGEGENSLVFVQHPPVVTLGRRGSEADLRHSITDLKTSGLTIQPIDRGGLATAHEPGQLVLYPLLRLLRHDLRLFVKTVTGAVVTVLADYGLNAELIEGEPGVWIGGRKVASFGIAVKRWVTCHGLALNVNNDLATFLAIVPCGHPDVVMTSLQRELGETLDMVDLQNRLAAELTRVLTSTVESTP
ncbi:MAG: hypothetical protein C0621_06175 [Desulfuromonas sp.]|nr:MAG: hypothetical protein C0621_06175 [Desulfuromonas sp.]